MNKRIIWNPKILTTDKLIDVSILRKTFIGDSIRRSLEVEYYEWKLVNNYYLEGKITVTKAGVDARIRPFPNAWTIRNIKREEILGANAMSVTAIV